VRARAIGLANCVALRAGRIAVALTGPATLALTVPAWLALTGPAALALTGCATLPVPSSQPTTAPPAVASAQRTHELPTPAPYQTAPAFPTPLIAIEVFATGYINWTAETIARQMRLLARLSVGQARSAVTLDATQTAQDYELRRGGVANSGTVEAVAPVLGTAYEYAVVTRERTTASNTTAYDGLAPAWHLALATVTRLRGGGWAVSSWQPES
jgi:hypothetical protein